jgi:hypothetical protein
VPLLPPPGAPQWAAELGTLLSVLTAAEEAAIRIRQVTPLLSIIRLSHGNIGVNGNISCVGQRSKLNRVLPNLPSDCHTVVLERELFSRANIEIAVDLVDQSNFQFDNCKHDSHRQLAVVEEEAFWDDAFLLHHNVGAMYNTWEVALMATETKV